MPEWIAIDVETASPDRDSLCAVAVVHGRGLRIVDTRSWLVRPPTRRFTFSRIHGITWEHVADAPSFGEVWREGLGDAVARAEVIVAHNASFDRSVLRACLVHEMRALPGVPWLCTVRLARRLWPQAPSARLPDVCEHLGIPLHQHHRADEDARACARIALAGCSELGVPDPVHLLGAIR